MNAKKAHRVWFYIDCSLFFQSGKMRLLAGDNNSIISPPFPFTETGFTG